MAYFGGSTTARPWPRFDSSTLILSLAILVVVAGLAFLGFDRYSSRIQAVPVVHSAPPEALEVPILIASEDIPPGKLLNASMFATSPRVIKGMESLVLTDFATIAEKYAIAPIKAGTPLFSNQISDYPPSLSFTSRIPNGMRAISIRVNAESAVEGWARPGARADVVWSTEHRGREVVTTIVENVEILSAGAAVRAEAEKPSLAGERNDIPSHVTLLVSIADAQKIQIAKTSGSLYLNLRGDEDKSPSNSGTITVGNLLKSSGLVPFDDVEARIKVDGREYVLSGGEIEPVESGEESHFRKFFSNFSMDDSTRASLGR